jgi:hypothetical protein
MLPILRSRLLWVTFVSLVLVVLAARFWAGGYAVRTVLGMAGASAIHYSRVEATPWRVVVHDLEFRVRTQDFKSRRVTVERDTWWMASLGRIRVEEAQIPVVLDGSDRDPWNWTSYEDTGLGDEPVNLPFQTLDLSGELIVRMAALPDRPIAITLEGRPKGGSSWIGSLEAEGVGFHLAGVGSLLRAGQELDFQVNSASLDLGVWSDYIQHLVLLPGGTWRMQGRLSGVAEGKVTAKRFAATARVSLREGGMKLANRDIAATGAEADLEFSDLWKLRTKSGALRLSELRVGVLPLREITADFGLWGGEEIMLNTADFSALGGRVRVDPLKFRLSQRELMATLNVSGLDLARLPEIVADLAVPLTGRMDGSFPLRIQDTGIRLERGQLRLRPGQVAGMQVNAATLLRSGAVFSEETQAILKNAGGRSLPLVVREFAFDLRPADIPLGCTARVSAAGDSEVGPLSFVYHVNGSVERHLAVFP